MDLEPSPKTCVFPTIIFFLLPLAFATVIILGWLGYLPIPGTLLSTLVTVLVGLFILPLARHNAYIMGCRIHEGLQGIDRKLYDYLDRYDLKIGGQNKSMIDMDQMLKSFIERSRNRHFSDAAPAMLAAIGILGTLVLLSVSVHPGETTSENLTALPLSTLFFPAIYGILFALWWLLFEKIGLSRIDAELYRIKDRYAERIWSEGELKRTSILTHGNGIDKLIGYFDTVFDKGFAERVEQVNHEKLSALKEAITLHDEINKLIQDKYNELLEIGAEREKEQFSHAQKMADLTKAILEEAVSRLEKKKES